MSRHLRFLLIAGLCTAAACGDDTPPFTPEIPTLPAPPLGLQAPPVPADNPMTPEKVALGWQLFYDGRLSSDGSVSCSSCHLPEAGFADPRPVSTGVGGALGLRNAPSIINAAYNGSQFWDGRAASLEAQALEPIQGAVEMANTEEALSARLGGIPGYRQQFEAVFGDPAVTLDRVVKAIAAFERVVLSGDSPWDRVTQLGDSSAVSAAVLRGAAVFEGSGRCTECHGGSVFIDGPAGEFHNLGVGMSEPTPDLGRFTVTSVEADRGAFRTSGLRNIAQTAPYMHDGSIATLEEVIEFYDRGGDANPWLSPDMQPLNLTAQQKADLLAFMQALTGEVPAFTKRIPPLPPEPGGTGAAGVTGTR